MNAPSDLLALSPCPFCGRDPVRADRVHHYMHTAQESQSMGMGVSAGGFSSTTYAIRCECGINVEGNNDVLLVRRWNARPSLSAQAVGDDAEKYRFLRDKAFLCSDDVTRDASSLFDCHGEEFDRRVAALMGDKK